MNIIFDVCIDSWKADPELNNVQLYVEHSDVCHSVYVMGAGIRLSCYSFSVPNVRLLFGNIRIFLLKRRMRRENTLREGSNNASH